MILQYQGKVSRNWCITPLPRISLCKRNHRRDLSVASPKQHTFYLEDITNVNTKFLTLNMYVRYVEAYRRDVFFHEL